MKDLKGSCVFYDNYHRLKIRAFLILLKKITGY